MYILTHYLLVCNRHSSVSAVLGWLDDRVSIPDRRRDNFLRYSVHTDSGTHLSPIKCVLLAPSLRETWSRLEADKNFHLVPGYTPPDPHIIMA
jgi:hypothetical protein